MSTPSTVSSTARGGSWPPAMSPCESGLLERPRYFPRQLITADEMTLEQRYFRDRLRRHNRLLHGWGVVCGAVVCRLTKEDGDPDPWRVTVTSGYVLAPFGDEIVIACDHTVDLRSQGVSGTSGDPCAALPDPWCSEVTVERHPGPVYLAVRYKEILTRPVRVQPAGCGCEEAQCEYSRWQDGYEICLLDRCPDSHTADPPDSFDCSGPLQHCPPCPEEPWVVLARIELDENGITCVDNYSCRRVVMSFASHWCRPTAPEKRGERPPEEERPREEPCESPSYDEMRARLAEVVDLTRADFPPGEEVGGIARWPGARLRGVTPESTLGRKIKRENLDVHSIAEMSEEELVKLALEGETERRGPMEKQAREVWRNARRAMELIEEWER